MSAKLCFFAAKGVMDPTVLQGLTVATVKFQPGTGRRLRLLGTPRPSRVSRLPVATAPDLKTDEAEAQVPGF